MKTLSAVAASQKKVRLAAFVIACAGVFLFFGCPLEHLLFRPLSNEVVSVLLQSAVLALFALGVLTAPGRKSRWRAGWELLFILGIMLGWIFLKKHSDSGFEFLLLFPCFGRLIGKLRRQTVRPLVFQLMLLLGAAVGILCTCLLKQNVPGFLRSNLFFAGILIAAAWVVLRLIWNERRTGWLRIPLILLWGLLLWRADLDLRAAGRSPKDYAEPELKTAMMVETVLQPNRKDLKILLLSDHPALVRQLSVFPLTRKLVAFSLCDGLDLYRKLNAESDDFDLIVLQLPVPESLSADRLYSSRFFQILKDRLAEDGVLSVWLPEEEFLPPNRSSELFGRTGADLQKLFPKVIPADSESLILQCGGDIVTNSPLELHDRAGKLLPAAAEMPEGAFLMTDQADVTEREHLFQTVVRRDRNQGAEKLHELLWDSIRSAPALDGGLGRMLDAFRGKILTAGVILTLLMLVIRYFFSAGTENKRNWLTLENGFFIGSTAVFFLLSYQQATGRLSLDWLLQTALFVMAMICGVLFSRPVRPQFRRIVFGLSLLLPVCGWALLSGWHPEPMILYASIASVCGGYTAGMLVRDIRMELSEVLLGISVGMVTTCVLCLVPDGMLLALILALLVRIAPLAAGNLQKSFDKRTKSI
ncbi:MAG: hypothetical protein J5806_13225 [Lentisphaeria bacterium]|nr:hypothetical protein [Lentisphaeria bacterium]